MSIQTRTVILTGGLALALVAATMAAGFFVTSGGPAKAVLARTQTTPSALAEGAWQVVPGTGVTRVVPAGTSDLFSVSFSAECQVRSLGVGDTARIRIAHFINGIQVAPLEPYDGLRPTRRTGHRG